MDGKKKKREKKTGNRNCSTETIYSSRHVLVTFYFGSLAIFFIWQSVLKAFVNHSFLSPDPSLLKKKKKKLLKNVQVLINLYKIVFQFSVSTIYTAVATEPSVWQRLKLNADKQASIFTYLWGKVMEQDMVHHGHGPAMITVRQERRVLICAHRKRKQSVEKGQNEVERQPIEIDGEKYWEWEGPPHSMWEHVGGDEILRLKVGKERWKCKITHFYRPWTTISALFSFLSFNFSHAMIHSQNMSKICGLHPSLFCSGSHSLT